VKLLHFLIAPRRFSDKITLSDTPINFYLLAIHHLKNQKNPLKNQPFTTLDLIL